MLPLRFVRRWRVASVAILLLVLVSTLMPAVWFFSSRREFVTWFFDVDKYLHGIIFVILALWFAGQYRPRSYWQIAIGLLLFGLFIEGCQRLVTYRSAEWFDVVADLAGIVLGLCIAMAGLGGWSLRLENWYANRYASASPE
jgi:VanZ family protein